MTRWVRFSKGNQVGFGTLERDTVAIYQGDMFDNPAPSGDSVALGQVDLLTPVTPGTLIALWNNFHERAAAEGLPIPEDPLYFLKPASCFHPHGQPIRRPASFDGRIIFEAELGVVIGKQCHAVPESQASDYVFGYTCVNDVTAVEIIKKNPTFDQWTRAKGYDTFGVCGPHITTDVDPTGLVVKAVQNGEERQNYPVSDMVFSPLQLVSRISQDMTLYPGDVIACGTSLGFKTMRDGDRIDVVIDGVGTLSNTLEG